MQLSNENMVLVIHDPNILYTDTKKLWTKIHSYLFPDADMSCILVTEHASDHLEDKLYRIKYHNKWTLYTEKRLTDSQADYVFDLDYKPKPRRIMIDTEGFTGRPSEGIGPITSIGMYDGENKWLWHLDWYVLGSVNVNLDTLKWWFAKGLVPVIDDTACSNTKNVLELLWSIINTYDEIWCRGPDYDMQIIEYWSRILGVTVPDGLYTKYRCHRTIVPKMEKKNSHTALEDAINQWEALHDATTIN